MQAPIPGVPTSDHPIDLRAASRDLWPGGTLDFWQGRPAPFPSLVAWPEDEAQVERVLQAAHEQGLAVVPYGAGSGVCGGARGREGAITLDLKRMNRIGPLDADRLTVEAEAGVIGQHLEDWLQARGYTLGHSPSSIWCSSVGGWAAARSAGQFSSRYGVFEDMVLALRAVAPGLGAFTVGEDGDAPDELMPLLLGSEGTLAVITRARMRVWPLPARRWLRGYRFPDVASATDAMRRLMQGELHPSVVRLYDPVDTRIGGKTKPKKAGGDGGRKAFVKRWLRRVERLPAVRRRSLVLPLALPGLLNRLVDRMASGCLLVVGWEGEPEVVAALSTAGHRILCEQGEDLGPEPGERWYASRHAVSYKLMPVFERGGFADTMEVACRWSQLVPLYHAVRGALGRTAVVMAHMSHAYPEGCSIYFSFAGRGDPQVYRRTWEAGLRACLEVGGTVSHHHGIGELKAWAASAEAGPAVAGWQARKAELDPQGLLNPGRLYAAEGGPPDTVGPPAAEDGLVQVPLRSSMPERQALATRGGGELAWPWARVSGPAPWLRAPWQTGWVEVAGTVQGQPCRLGRGPRSATGVDLRGWLAEHVDEGATVTLPMAPPGARWMGEGTPDAPYEVALALLRADLRPAVLAVRDGALRVGFRGPAAAALGGLAAGLVPGGLTEVAWRPEPLPAEPLQPCSPDDPRACWVSPQGVFRPGGEG